MMRYYQYTIKIPVMLLMTLMFGAVVVGCVTGIGDVDVTAVEAGVVIVHTARNPVLGMDKSEWNLSVISLPEDWNGPGISKPQNFAENPS